MAKTWGVLGVAAVLLCVFGVNSYLSRYYSSPPDCPKQPSVVPVLITRETSSPVSLGQQVLPMPVCAASIEGYRQVGLMDLSLPSLLRSSDLCRLNRTATGNFEQPCELHRMIVLYYWVALTLSSQNLTWWLNAGSILGALRTGGVMPHDRDGDLYVLISNEEEMAGLVEAVRLISLHAPDMFYSTICSPGDGCTCTCRKPTLLPTERCPSFACLKRPGAHAFWILTKDAVGHMDVVTCTPHPTHPERIWCNGNPPAHDILREDVLPLIQCNFHGQAFPCPRQPGRYLTHLPDFVHGDIQKPPVASASPLASYTTTCLQRGGWPNVGGCHNKANCKPIGKEFQRDFEYDTPWFPYGPKTGINVSFVYNWFRADESAFRPTNKTQPTKPNRTGTT